MRGPGKKSSFAKRFYSAISGQIKRKELLVFYKSFNAEVIFIFTVSLERLLGTVTGMIVTFQQITLFGTGDPKIMAGGISQALVTTVLGLVVAIPTTLLHSFANSSARGIINVLEEQSTGIVAEHSDSK